MNTSTTAEPPVRSTAGTFLDLHRTTWRFARLRVATRQPGRRWGDRGEGVISAAIAVLVMAFLGVAMWVGLKSIWDTAETNTSDQVNEIGE